ncbi:MAG: BREX-1 system adenine-specific DNA-methyltransferase PglX [Planctomycetes bacterium]|nr:BREX-1 system adenine-specific DNA-methyltransferase PglX [Planctomycetota bacterium]
MDHTQLKNYAPAARTAFIEACKSQAARLGITAEGNATPEIQGDVLLVGGSAFPKSVASGREALVRRVKAHGFDATIDAIAYTWFNRFVAIRYMELHGYLDHGYRVLSHPGGDPHPEVLEHAADIELTGLDHDQVVTLKLDGSKDEELYRLLLLAQCNALHRAMPFLFERIGNETELLLPANLLHTDSLIRQLVERVDEGLWQDIEIIGWLYQFYISEKKGEVIGKVVKSEDIPAATQLFTPNWIVKYMVQNSLGAQWMGTYPDSPLKAQMEYYIEPAEQTAEVKAQLAAITPSQLDPKELTLIDPASGSGHILVEAYELFKAIYLERGYRQRDVPQMILGNNLFGLDIDERAAQLTGFALMMKGRADDRRLFERGVKLNVMALVDSAGFDAEGLAKGVQLSDYDLRPGDLTELKRLFEHATTFGSLIQVPEGLVGKLPTLKQLSEANSQDLFVAEALKRLGPLVQQAKLLAKQYDAVVANPPYMGSGWMNGLVKRFVKDCYPNVASDLYACFLERGFRLAKNTGHNAMVTMETWMFLSSYDDFRGNLLGQHTLRNLAHFPYDGKRPTAMGINFGVAVMTAQEGHLSNYRGRYCCSRHYELNDNGVPVEFPTRNERLRTVPSDEFGKISGFPIAYWASERVREIFDVSESLGSIGSPTHGVVTGDNDRFLRYWSEVSDRASCFDADSREKSVESNARWFPVSKGGPFRRWFGNNEFVIDWLNDGRELQTTKHHTGRIRATNFNLNRIFQPGITWSRTSNSALSMRYLPAGMIFESKGSVCFSDSENQRLLLLAISNTKVINALLQFVSPTIDFNEGSMSRVPVAAPDTDRPVVIAERCRELAQIDWNAYERSQGFESIPLLTTSSDPAPSVESSYAAWITQNRDTIAEMKRLEEENNRLFIDAYGLAEELTPDVPIEQITLTVNPAYRYGKKVTEEEQWTRFRQDTLEELISYAIGCMMGRYSLDAPGLIYADSGNEGFDPGQYNTFPADDDGIVPLTDTEWFDDDACHRIAEFISVSWDKAHLEDNLTFLADNLGPKKNESSRETIRRWLNDKFFKDHHLKRYKKRPIYWLFSSGKQKAFQALVYLHRYNEGTLARMRSEYVIPLQGKIVAQLERLEGDVKAAESTPMKKRLGKDQIKLQKQQVELLAFDEKLRHYADKRITLDLDDGVKVNYGKFGDLLAEVKAVHGKKAEGV